MFLPSNTAVVASTFDLAVDRNFLEIGTTYEDVIHENKHHVDASIFAKIPVNSTKAPGVGAGVKYRNDDGDSAHLKASVHLDNTATISIGASKRLYSDKNSNVDLSQSVSVTVGLDGGIRGVDISLPGLPSIGF